MDENMKVRVEFDGNVLTVYHVYTNPDTGKMIDLTSVQIDYTDKEISVWQTSGFWGDAFVLWDDSSGRQTGKNCPGLGAAGS